MKKCISILIIAVMVLSMTACGSKDKIPTSEEINGQDVTLVEEDSQEEETEESSEKETTPTEIGVDFDADVRAGLLWINNDGRVVDKDGNLIESYSYITALDRKTLLSESDIMEGYAMSDDMQIIIDEAYLQQVAEDSADPDFASGGTYYDELLSIADATGASQKNQPLGFTEFDYQSLQHLSVYLEDKGSPYFPDIIYGNYWENGIINGTPLIDSQGRDVWMPENLAGYIYDSGIASNTMVSDLRLIDQDSCTIDSIKRSDPSDLLYAFYVQNIEKGVDSYGNVYFTGYLDLEYVCVYGDFDKILNGDNVFVYGAFDGLNINDVPIFKGGYVEILNN